MDSNGKYQDFLQCRFTAHVKNLHLMVLHLWLLTHSVKPTSKSCVSFIRLHKISDTSMTIKIINRNDIHSSNNYLLNYNDSIIVSVFCLCFCLHLYTCFYFPILRSVYSSHVSVSRICSIWYVSILLEIFSPFLLNVITKRYEFLSSTILLFIYIWLTYFMLFFSHFLPFSLWLIRFYYLTFLLCYHLSQTFLEVISDIFI